MNRLMGVACLTSLLGCCTGCGNPGKNHLDIALEGPWIIYQDNNFHSNGKTVPVLIVMAPAVSDSMKPFPHHPPTFTAGDGSGILPGINCVAFDGQCAMKRKAKRISSDDYPSVPLLSVKVRNGWAWNKDSFAPDRTFLILPIPDSISNDGEWNIRFGSKWDPNGVGYGNGSLRSIGLHLHYDSGPANLQLLQCKAPDDSPDATHCNTPVHTLANTGTLRIEMKAPDTNNACDFHVRAAYRQMLLMLDSTELNPATQPRPNINQDKAYGDPARFVDKQGNANYYDPASPDPTSCLYKDPQQPGYRPPVPAESPIQMNQAVIPFLGSIYAEVSDIKRPATNCEANPRQDPFLACEIRDQIPLLDQGTPQPRISQLSWIAYLLRSSAANALEASRNRDNDKDKLEGLATAELHAADRFATKNGNDCRAEIMIVEP
jgi:hypothetical protein